MIQVIDYQTDNLYGLIIHDYRGLEVKINNVEFKLDHQKEATITSLPDKIFKKVSVPAQIEGYINTEGRIMSVEEWNAENTRLKSFKEYDNDSEELIWVTKEDKVIYDDFIKEWTPVYSKPEIVWKEENFEIVVKEFIPEKYKDFIKSSIIINTENKVGHYKAICTYYPNPSLTIRKVGLDLGFIEVPDKNFSDNTLGKHFSISNTNPLEYSRVNNVFLSLSKNYAIFRECKGSLEHCIEQYQKDYNLVYNKFLIQKNLIENKQIDPEERKELYTLLERCLSAYNRIDASKRTMSDYNSLGKTLISLKNKIALTNDKEGN